jgi:methylmalonyl-CoA mutase C-terminal domain/subunit
LQEDVDCVGLSILSGAHMTLFPKIIALLEAKGLDEIPLFGGGIIPDDDIIELKNQGVKQVFTPGASTSDIVGWIHENIQPRA